MPPFSLSARLLAAIMFSAAAALCAPAQAQDAPAEPTAAQAKLPTAPLTITGRTGAKHVFTVELATTFPQQEVGEMFRSVVPADEGMLFVWDPPIVSRMWMKNTLVPLDMVFIAADGTIAHIAEDTVPESLAEVSSGVPVKATLELQGGITAKDDIRVGDKVTGAIFK